jgi:hypothetical protein
MVEFNVEPEDRTVGAAKIRREIAAFESIVLASAKERGHLE